MALPRDLAENLVLPVFTAQMFLCSSQELAAACCRAGVVGSLTANYCRNLTELEAQLAYASDALAQTKNSAGGGKIGPLAGIEDVLYTRGINGLLASWLKASLRALGLDPDNLFIPEGRGTDHLPEGKTPWRGIWSGGQATGLIDDIPTVPNSFTGSSTDRSLPVNCQIRRLCTRAALHRE